MAGTNRFVSAGAGSGKTYRLKQILHEKLSSGQAAPGGVIATTFTRKAATELRERVRTALLEKGEFALANAMGHSVRYVLGTEQQSPSVYPHWDFQLDTSELRQALHAELA